MKIIHTQIVTEYTKLLPENKILGQQAPEIHHSEELLPRKTRCTLSQLRTNKSPFLLSYKHKINPTLYPSPLCPLCKNDEHNTSHLFNCTHIPTTLTPLDLWNAPRRVTELLEAWEEKVAALSG